MATAQRQVQAVENQTWYYRLALGVTETYLLILRSATHAFTHMRLDLARRECWFWSMNKIRHRTIIGIILSVLAMGYVGFWFYAADQITSQMENWTPPPGHDVQ